MSLYLDALNALAAARQARDLARPEFAAALDLDYFDHDERPKPVAARRYCVAQFVWRGRTWRRMRRLTGPKTFNAALDELPTHLKRTGFPHVRDA